MSIPPVTASATATKPRHSTKRPARKPPPARLPSFASTLADLKFHLAYLEAEFEAARQAPLSTRKALLVAMLIDAHIDRLFETNGESDDVLTFRGSLAAADPALSTIMDLCAFRSGSPRVILDTVAVPLSDYQSLSIEDFMDSLYNDHTMERVQVLYPDGSRQDAHVILAEAISTLRRA